MVAADIAPLLAGLTGSPMLFVLVVIGLSFLLEDATALAVGVLGAHMLVDPWLALSALLLGTIAGDILLHGLGRFAGRHPWVQRHVSAGGGVVRTGRSPLLVAGARFVPGLRLPAYLGSGAAGMPFLTFTAIVLLTGFVWTPLLYLSAGLLGGSSWGLAGVALAAVTLFLLPMLLRRLGLLPALAPDRA